MAIDFLFALLFLTTGSQTDRTMLANAFLEPCRLFSLFSLFFSLNDANAANPTRTRLEKSSLTRNSNGDVQSARELRGVRFEYVLAVRNSQRTRSV